MKIPPHPFSLPFNVLSQILPNGMRVFVVQVPASRVASISLVIRAGSSAEHEHEAGGLHFLEHMLFCGTKRRKNTHELTRTIERLGALLDAETSKEDTTYSVRTPISHLEASCDLIADMFFDSTLPVASVNRERSVILEELADDVDDIGWHCSQLLERMLFGNNPLSRSVIGERKTIEQFTRASLLGLKEKWYQPSNTFLVATGPLDTSFFEIAHRYFGRGKPSKVTPPRLKPSPSRSRFSSKEIPRDRATIRLGFPIPGYGKVPEPELVLAEMILGRSSYSRLDQCLRLKQGLAYSYDCGRIVYRSCGYEEVATEVAPAKVPQVLDTVIDCLSKFARKGVTRSELTDAKSCAVGRAILGTESCFDLADFACDEILTHGSVVHPEEIVASLQAVTLDRLNGVIREVFDPSRCKIAVVGGLPSRLESPL